jgi:hypothetical protein
MIKKYSIAFYTNKGDDRIADYSFDGASLHDALVYAVEALHEMQGNAHITSVLIEED